MEASGCSLTTAWNLERRDMMLLVAEPIQGEQETAMLSSIIDAGRIAMADEVRDFGVMRLAPPPDEIHPMMAAQAERVWSRLF